MKVLILNGFDYDTPEQSVELALMELLRDNGYHFVNVKLADKNIKPCKGCFNCWVKTPGECIIKDDSQEICKIIINSDLVVILTPVVFGGYSGTMKKMIDKIIPLILPFFGKYFSETHHIPRYDKYPCILGIGILKENLIDESLCFQKIVLRNSLNFHSPLSFAKAFQSNEEGVVVKNSLRDILYQIEKYYAE